MEQVETGTETMATDITLPHAARRALAPLRAYILGPVLFCIASSLILHFFPWPIATSEQAALLAPGTMAILLGLGAIGVMLSPFAGFPSRSPPDARAQWRALLMASAVPGLLLGGLIQLLQMLSLGEEYGQSLARSIGTTWVNVPLPGSLLHYAALAILLEDVYRLAPIPIVVIVFGRLLLKGRYQGTAFWIAALLTSTIEPLQQTGSLTWSGIAPSTLALYAFTVATIFTVNLLEAVEYRRFGWPAPIVVRISVYLVIHVVGPYLYPHSSIYYPGPR